MKRVRKGAAVHLAIGLVAASAITWAGISSVATSTSSVRARVKLSPLTNQELAIALTRVAFDPQPLAAVGLNAEAATELVGRVRDHLTTGIIDLRAADADWSARNAEVDRLERLIRGGQRSEQNLIALANARTALATATTTRQGVLDAIVTAGIGEGGLSGPQTATLATILAGRGGGGPGGWELPTKYLAASREQTAWVALRDALANLRISAEQGVSPDPTAQSIVTAANANQAVAAAAAGLENLATVQSAWNQAVFP